MEVVGVLGGYVRTGLLAEGELRHSPLFQKAKVEPPKIPCSQQEPFSKSGLKPVLLVLVC